MERSEQLDDTEYEWARSLAGPDRHRYAIERIRESAELWLLGDEQSVATFRTPDGQQVIYIWPHERFARDHATGKWGHFRPFRQSLSSFFKLTFPELLQKRFRLGVFLTYTGQVVVVTPEDFDAHLRHGPP